MTALDELLTAFAEHKETPVSVVFAEWTRDWLLDDDERTETSGPADIPKAEFGKIIPWAMAAKYLRNWSIEGGYGTEQVYPLYVWTDRSVYYIGCYGGSTWLARVPRHPVDCTPVLMGC